MKSLVLLASVTICLVVLRPFSYADDNPHSVLDKLVQEYFAQVSQSSFAGAAALFHYPKQYSPGERSKDTQAVTQLLKVMPQEFGVPANRKVLEKPYMIYNVSAGGGDLGYWQHHPFSLQKQYEVIFSREAAGYVTMQFCNVTGVWEIRSVSYGLPAQRADAKARITDIQNKLLQEMAPFMKESEDQTGKPI